MWFNSRFDDLATCMDTPDQVDWGDLAGAWAGTSGVFAALATLLIVLSDLRERARMDLYSAKLNAQSAMLANIRARFETFHRGSEVEFGRQHFESDDEFDSILRQTIEGVTDERLIRKARDLTEKWKATQESITKLLEEAE